MKMKIKNMYYIERISIAYNKSLQIDANEFRRYPNLGKAYANASGSDITVKALPNNTIAATFAGSCW